MDTADAAIFIATAFTALGTLGLAISTFVLARKTGDMVKVNKSMLDENRRMVEINSATLEEMKTNREAQERPFVSVELDYEQYPMLYVLIRNFGRGPAVNVGFTFYPELETPENARARGGGESLGLSSRELPLFTQGIELLPPGARISLWWGATDLVIKDFYERNLQRHGIQVEIFYESLDGQHYREETYLNPTNMEPVIYFQPQSLSRLVKPMVKVAEKLDKALERHGFLKIKTATERREEEEARWQNTLQQAEATRREVERQQEDEARRREQDDPEPKSGPT